MDTLYYSNFCKHSQKVLQFLVKSNLANQLNFLCIDKRNRDPNNNQIYIVLENGQRVIMPPNIQSVPALLLVKQNYRVILGDNIIQHFQSAASAQGQNRPKNGFSANTTAKAIEPTGISLSPSNHGMNILSEPYTFYNLTPDELSAKGSGGRRQMYNYISADQEIISINTPPETYHPDKVSNDVTVDILQQKRMNENQKHSASNSPFVPKI